MADMPPEEGRRKKHPVSYEVLLVPQGEGGTTRSFYASRWRLWVFGLLTSVLLFAVVVTLLVYTPIAMYIPIKNPELEARYGKQILETQQRLDQLARDVLILRDYNQQLRKALGEFDSKDTATGKMVSSRVAEHRNGQPPLSLAHESGVEDLSGADETYGEYDLTPGSLGIVLTTQVGFRGAFPLLAPTEGFVTQDFDRSRYHFGIDYAVKQGTPIYAATDGYVVFAGWTYDDGNMIILSHGGGYLTVYKHNQLLLRSSPAFVKRGELIAQSGSTGQTSSGPHLHFEVWKDGVPQDPQEYLLTAPKIQ
jgi:murein DD-endopeptidase MepM/ murein hydrolase activator NlpD